jgi:hypothetical protein
MANDDDLDPEHLAWLVDSRTANQKTSLQLFRLFKDHPETIKNPKYSGSATALVAISFSLWRAAFLADKSGTDEATIKDAEYFLGKMIVDNAIAYPQDRKAREWTFNYYAANARSRLDRLARKWPDILPDAPARYIATDRWNYLQSALEKSVSYFEQELGQPNEFPSPPMPIRDIIGTCARALTQMIRNIRFKL